VEPKRPRLATFGHFFLSRIFSWADDFSTFMGLHKPGRLDCLSPNTARRGHWPRKVAGMHFPAPISVSGCGERWCSFHLFIVHHRWIVHAHQMPYCYLARLSGRKSYKTFWAGRDPQLAILYTLVVLDPRVSSGGGRISLDARLFAKSGNNQPREMPG